MSTFTVTDVLEAIEAAVAANPEGLNPMSDDQTCLNRSDDPDATTPRCIASQVHFDLTGRELGGKRSRTIGSSLWETYGDGAPFDEAAKDMLRSAQRSFDGNSQRGVVWSQSLLDFKAKERLS